MGILISHPVLSAFLASLGCLFSARQDFALGSRATSMFWQGLAYFFLTALPIVGIVSGSLVDLLFALACVAGEVWLIRRWKSSPKSGTAEQE